MSLFLKIAIVVAGLAGLGGGIVWFGLPPKAPQQAQAPVQPAAPAPAPQQQAVVQPQASAPAAAPSPAPAAPAPAAPAPSIPAPAAAPLPAFDIVRVEPTGESVVAGRAEPGSQVTLMLNGKPFASVTVGPAGQFTLIPPNLPAGSHELTLEMKGADGKAVASTQSIAAAVPSTPRGEVIVALQQPGQPTQLLSKPAAVAAAPSAPAAQPASAASAPSAPAVPAGERPKVALTTVEAEDGGRFYASGVAAPGATVRLYLNDSFLAAATASPQGGWSFTIGRGLAPGSYRVRIDDVEAEGGKVLSRAEVSFDYAPRVASAAGASVPGAPPAADAPAATPGQQAEGAPSAPPSDVTVAEIRSTQVTRGDSLWRISKRIYGKGVRFTVIYEANQKQIQDPDRIYPGQVFVLPNNAL